MSDDSAVQGPAPFPVQLRDLVLRLGKGTAVPVDQWDPEEVLADPALALSGFLSGGDPTRKEPGGFVLEIEHRPRWRGTRLMQVPLQERGRFQTRFLLRNGINVLIVRARGADGATLAETTFTVAYKSSFREWNETVFIAFFLALIIRSLVVQAFWIPTGSMEPTLLGEKRDPRSNTLSRSGDRILVNRFAYVADFSLDGRIPFGPRFWLHSPQRGDIIVFKYPDKNPNAEPRDFIKRVIGLPGDSIKVLDGTVLVNDVPLKEPYIAEPPWQDYETKVPLDSLFVMGDNRNNSADSRYWGPMPLKNLKGQAIFIYSPLKRIHPIRSHPHPSINPSLPDPHGD